MALTLVNPPTVEPLTLAELKRWCKVEHALEDADLLELGAACRSYGEERNQRQYLPATWRQTWDRFPAGGQPLVLERPPLRELTLLRHRDAVGTWATLDVATLQVDAAAIRGLVSPAPGEAWPATQSGRVGAVEATFIAGWPTPEALPATLRQALRLLAAHWHKNREAVIVGTISSPLPLGIETLFALHDLGQIR